jgi:hypothetical protein
MSRTRLVKIKKIQRKKEKEKMNTRIMMAILGSAMLLFHSNDAACHTTYSLRIFQILSPPGTPSVIQQNTASPPLALSYSSRLLFNMLLESEFLPHLRLRLRGGRVSLFLSSNIIFLGAPRFVLMFCLRITVQALQFHSLRPTSRMQLCRPYTCVSHV